MESTASAGLQFIDITQVSDISYAMFSLSTVIFNIGLIIAMYTGFKIGMLPYSHS